MNGSIASGYMSKRHKKKKNYAKYADYQYKSNNVIFY